MSKFDLELLKLKKQQLEELNNFQNSDLVYRSKSCCTRNRVKNFYLCSDNEQQIIKLFLNSSLSNLNNN